MYNIIDQLQENESDCYVVDFLPQKMDSNTYFEIEQIFLKTYLKEFSQKINRIVLKLCGYYTTQICITEYPIQNDRILLCNYPVGEDIRSISLIELTEVIDYVITNDISSVQILLGDSKDSLISIEGAFEVSVHSKSENLLNILNLLVTQEGLFLRNVGKE